MINKKIGITGCPGGATHFAASAFGVGHEKGLRNSRAIGVADYMLAVPPEHWPAPGILNREYPGKAYVTQVKFKTCLTILRNPLRVVSTNLGLRNLPFLEGMASIIDVKQEKTEKAASWATRVFLAWYRQCLDWSDGKYIRAEDGPRIWRGLNVYDGPITAPIPKDRYHRGGPRRSNEDLEAELTQQAKDELDAFMEKYYP